MKILMIGSNLRVPGGITRVVKNYIQAGIKDKVNFEYFPTYYGGKNYENIIYFIIQYFNLSLKLFIFKKNYDVAHIHMSYKGSFIRKKHIINLLVKNRIPVILHMHGSQFKDFYRDSVYNQKIQITKTLNKVNVILALGEEWKEYYESICRTNVIILQNSVFPKKNNTSIIDEKIYITTMGVLSKRKGTYDLIKVGERLKGKIDEKFKIVLAGNGEIQEVKKIINKLELNDFFIIPGWISKQEEIETIYRKSILYILPSYNEGMPMSILEAMSYGIPVISTNVGSIPSIIKEENGFIVNPGDIENIADIIVKLLDDKDKVSLLENNNIEKINKFHNVYNTMEEIYSLYEKLALNKNLKKNVINKESYKH